MNQTTHAAVETGPYHITGALNVHLVEQGAAIVRDGDVACQVIDNFRALKGAPECGEVAHVSVDGLHVEAGEAGGVNVYQCVDGVPPTQQDPHKVGSNVARGAGYHPLHHAHTGRPGDIANNYGVLSYEEARRAGAVGDFAHYATTR